MSNWTIKIGWLRSLHRDFAEAYSSSYYATIIDRAARIRTEVARSWRLAEVRTCACLYCNQRANSGEERRLLCSDRYDHLFYWAGSRSDVDSLPTMRGRPVQRACRNCGNCADGCRCVRCRLGSHWVVGDDTDMCSTCGACPSCCSARACDHCDQLYHPGDRCDVCDACNDCCDPDRHPTVEFFSQPPTFHVANRLQRKSNTSTRLIATEIEVASLQSGGSSVSSAVKRWGGSIVRDGSLPDGGFEINTSPASGDLWVAQVREICHALNDGDADVNSACGLHVHIDARDLGYYGIRRLILAYSALEPLLFQMVPPARRRSSYCEPCADHYMQHALVPYVGPYKAAKSAVAKAVYGTSNTRKVRDDKYNSARYSALNLHSWFYRGTVECRLFTGSTDARKITAWGMLWASIVDHAAKSDEKTVKALAAGVSSAAAQYRVLRTIIGAQPTVISLVNERLRRFGGTYYREAITQYETNTNTNNTDETRPETASQ